MKIALVILHADASRGGAERYTVDLAVALARNGHDVSVLASSFGASLPSDLQRVLLSARGPTRIWRYRHFVNSLESHLAQSSYDVVHAMLPVRHCEIYHPHAGPALHALAHGHEAHRGRIRRGSAWLGNRLNLKRNYVAFLERGLLCGERPPLVLCVSDLVARQIRGDYSVPDSRLIVLFNAVDTQRFVPPSPHPARPRVVALFVAHNFWLKGLGEAIQALARVGDPRLRLRVIGRDRIEPWAALARRFGVGDRVEFAGSTPDPRPAYTAADFFVLPTRQDACSLVALEALAMGLPVITTAANGACEIITPGEHGFVLGDPSDVPALADAMRKMLDEPVRSRMSQACRDLRPRLDRQRHVENLLSIYARVAAEKAGSGDRSA